MTWILHAAVLFVGVGICRAAVNCECMARATDADGTIAAYILRVDVFLGPSNTCKICNQKCEKTINRNTKNGDLNSVPFPILNRDKLGTLICKYVNATNLKSSPVQLYSVCNEGQPELCNFAVKNPSYICCENNVWLEGACPPP